MQRIVADHDGTIAGRGQRAARQRLRHLLAAGLSAPACLVTLLVGTAGHVDHGKTRLLEALTGIDCDRLPEEKRAASRSTSASPTSTRDGVELGFVDVPGHERFLHNALAGLGGIRACCSWSPPTRA